MFLYELSARRAEDAGRSKPPHSKACVRMVNTLNLLRVSDGPLVGGGKSALYTLKVLMRERNIS